MGTGGGRKGDVKQGRKGRAGWVSCLFVSDLQLRMVITSSSELRFGCSWTLWKSHLVNIPAICLWRTVGTEAGWKGDVGQGGPDRAGRVRLPIRE